MDYIFIKWVHVISSTILFGTGLGSAFYMFMANRQKNVGHIYLAVKHVVIADWLFTAPAVIIQLVTGLYLVHLNGFRFTDFWISAAIGLYFFVGLCWLPVVWLQIKMRNLAHESLVKNLDLPKSYWQLDRWWIILGSLAFPAVIAIFWLMVAKPS